jgi:hypothetical protein
MSAGQNVCAAVREAILIPTALAAPGPRLQLKAIAETSLALQLLGVLWRLMGQLVAVESLVFVWLRPKALQRLHELLATGAVSLSAALHRMGLTRSQLLPGAQAPWKWRSAVGAAV